MNRIALFTVLLFVLFTLQEVSAGSVSVVSPRAHSSHIHVGVGNNTPSTGVVYKTYRSPRCMHNNFVTPPPPPPIRYKYKYKDFAGKRNFPTRSYYIPSYCMPESSYYMDTHNPFCNHYIPYGSNLYISF